MIELATLKELASKEISPLADLAKDSEPMSSKEMNKPIDPKVSESSSTSSPLVEVSKSSEPISREEMNKSIESSRSFDDKGLKYIDDECLLPNIEYQLNGSLYKTDDLGRIIEVSSEPKLTPENTRDKGAQINVGGEYRLNNDQGGHYISRDMGGDSGLGNLTPMDSRINQSDYKRMENDIKNSIINGDDPKVKIRVEYTQESHRPVVINAEVIDNKAISTYSFDNNLDGQLSKALTGNDVKNVNLVKDRVGGEISSIKRIFSSDGNVESSIVRITYENNGINYRKEVVIK